MTKDRLQDAFDTYREDRDRTIEWAVARETVPLPLRAADAQHRARALRRLWRWQRHGRVMVPVLAALALGLHLWAGEISARVEEEQALASLLLLHEPSTPLRGDVVDDWIALEASGEEEER